MDQQLLLLINRQWTGPALDWLMVVMSSLELWSLPLILLFVAVVVRGRFRARAMLLTLGVAILLSDGVIANSLKKIVERPRPHQVLEGVRQLDLAKARPRLLALSRPLKVQLSDPPAVARVQGRSFPSAHTANNICAAVVVSAFYRRRGWLMFVPAFLVAYSRIYVGSHWPSDVLVSILLGLLLGTAVVASATKLWERVGPRFWPALFQKHPKLLGQNAV